MNVTFQRFTSANTNELPRRSHDCTNLTSRDRTISEYMKILGPLEAHIDNLAKQGKKIRILDCGAGSGVALSGLLRGKLNVQVEKCTGISLHYFKNAKRLLKEFPDQLEWYLGKAEDILPTLSCQYDIIFDVFGAYYYSKERPFLIEHYHRLLTNDGKAFINLYSEGALENVVMGSSPEKRIETIYQERFPKTFSIDSRGQRIFSIHKCRRTFPPLWFRLKKVERYAHTIGDNSHSVKTLKRGNAFGPQRVLFKERKRRYA